MKALNPRHLDAFAATVRTGSATAAAGALHTSQPSVSRMISDLEMQTEITLFRRQSGRLNLTEEGRLLFREIERHSVGLDQLANRIREIRNFEQSELRVASIPAAAVDLVPSVVARMNQTHRQLRTNSVLRSHGRTIELIASGQAQVGICNNILHPEAYRVCAQWMLQCILVMSADHPLTASSIVTLAELSDHQFISLGVAFNEQYASSPNLADQLNALAKNTTNLSLPALAQVAHGLGVALVDPLTAGLASGFGLAVRPFAQTVHYPLSIIETKAVPVTTLVDDFVELASSRIDEIRDAFDLIAV